MSHPALRETWVGTHVRPTNGTTIIYVNDLVHLRKVPGTIR